MNRIFSKFLQALWGQRFAALAALAVAGLLFTASGVKAGCYTAAKKASAAPFVPFVSPQDPEDSDEARTIVGLWHVIYTATSANGPFPPTPFEFNTSYKTWHGDGTEFDNVDLAPAGGNICYGVWKKLPNGSVKLHHIGQVFDPVSGKLVNILVQDEIDTVDRGGKTYTGYFDFKLFDPTDTFGTGTPLAEVKGTTVATRISVD
jgi:hypothetical protein